MNPEPSLKCVEIGSPGQKRTKYFFDRVFDEEATNETVSFQ
jgi:hypothetical protein